MRQSPPPVFRDVVLAGGGHAHALLVKRWGMDPLPGVRLTLVSPQTHSPYSGMLPGFIAGHYSFDDMHIDLVRLCHWAGVRFIRDTVTGIDGATSLVGLASRPAIEFDVLSVNTGASPAIDVDGAAEHAIPVKPISGFRQRWQALLDNLRQSPDAKSIGVVGGGAGSVEVVLAMARACRVDTSLRAIPAFHVLTQADALLPGYPEAVKNAARHALDRYGITLHESTRVTAVGPTFLQTAAGDRIDMDYVFWCTQAAAPAWVGESGIDHNEEGFIAVNAHLQSVSHPNIFAAGDIAHLATHPLPKAGVFAVRQAPVLHDNIRSLLLGRPLATYVPQRHFLSLLALGEKTAAGSRGWFSVSGAWAWRWKDRIDNRFMRQFRELPAMDRGHEKIAVPDILVPAAERGEILDSDIRCTGCGGKVGPQVLEAALRAFDAHARPEDASMTPWPSGVLVQSVDQISAPFDDPWLFGRVAVLHALNDLLARNAVPHSLQVALTLPFAGRNCQRRELQLLLAGVLDACREEGVALLGGHTGEGSAVTAAVTVNGIPGDPVLSKTGVQQGDVLMMTKALGTGVILAGHMQGKAGGDFVAAALESMAASNRPAARCMDDAQVHACTDISGFGLLGHLAEMLGDSELVPRIDLDKVPLLPGALDLVRDGVRSSLAPQNASRVQAMSWSGRYQDNLLWQILIDPQTSGGLLVSVGADAEPLLQQAGFRKIGYIA